MGLVSLASIEPLLVCPRCRAALIRSEDGFRCSSETCVLAAPASFPILDSRPVLVDFERSILPRSELAAGAHRPPVSHRWSIERVPRRLRSWLKPRNEVAARNIELLLSQLGEQATVLVVGGGTLGNGSERLYSQAGIGVIGFDIYASPLTQFLADALQIPLADASVDGVVVQAVLEHVLDPGRAVAEIHRVLRPRGLVYAETPFLQQVHAASFDFVRFTSSGHRYLFRNFEELAAGAVAGPGTQFLWSVDHLVRGLTRSDLAGKLARGLLFGLRYLDRIVPETYATDNASAFYFLGRRAERTLTPQEIVAYYRGAQQSRGGGERSRPGRGRPREGTN